MHEQYALIEMLIKNDKRFQSIKYLNNIKT